MQAVRESITLRPVSERDEGFLRLVYAESRREELDQVEWAEGQREAFLRMQFDAQANHYVQHYIGAEYLVIEENGNTVGRFYVQRSRSEIRIMDIALIPSARGRGIGTLLLQQVIQEGQSSGRVVSIHVEKFNPALRLYARLGFQVAADRGVYWLLNWKAS